MAKRDINGVEKEIQWAPGVWKNYPIKHSPFSGVSVEEMDKITNRLTSLPPLVYPLEIQKLRKLLAEAAEGQRFILQGGDCAETFADCNEFSISSKLKIILQMSLVIAWNSRKPLVRIGRIAGQYAKPRSSPTEIVNGKEVPSFFGDCVNGIEISERKPNPQRLVEGYFHSASTLNYVRSLLAGGFSDLHQALSWDLDYVGDRKAEYNAMAAQLLDSFNFLDATGVVGDEATKIEMYTSHEGLILPYEEGMTRQWGDRKWYNTGAHLIWIGDRTRQVDHAHVHYCK